MGRAEQGHSGLLGKVGPLRVDGRQIFAVVFTIRAAGAAETPDQIEQRIKKEVADALARAGHELKARELDMKERVSEAQIKKIVGEAVQTGVQAAFSAMQAGAQVANGGVPQGPIVYDPVIIQQEVYPWAPLSLGLGLGLGLGYYQGPGPSWGYPHRPGFVPYRPYGWTHPPRPIYTPFHRPHPHGGFVPRSRR